MNNASDDGWVLREWRAATGITDRDPAIVEIGATLTMGRATFTVHGGRFPLRLVQSIEGTKRVAGRKRSRYSGTGTLPRFMSLGDGFGDRDTLQRAAYNRALSTGRW